MPQLDDLLAKALQKEPKKTFTRGNRPDRIASGYLLEPPLGPEKSGAKVESEPEPQVEPKWSQSEVKVEPKASPKSESRAKVETKPEPQVEPKWSQSEVKVEPKVEPSALISSIVGLQRKTLMFIYESCRFSGSKTSSPFAIQNIADGCKSSISAVKKALQRLEKKHLLRRVEYKDGRSGWTRYQLPNQVYGQLLQDETGAKVESNWSQSRVKVGTKLEPEPEPMPPSSSSKNLDLTKLTNTGDIEGSDELPLDWSQIDPTPLSAVRFGRHQLAQLVRVGILTSDQVQESIYAFAFDLEVNGKGRDINGHALNYFMGILRKGPYAPPANYEPPGIRQMRLYLEAKEREQKARVELETRLEVVEFDEWAAGLTAEERIRLVPVTDFAKPGSQGHNVQLKQYFREKVWPELREKGLRGET